MIMEHPSIMHRLDWTWKYINKKPVDNWFIYSFHFFLSFLSLLIDCNHFCHRTFTDMPGMTKIADHDFYFSSRT